MMSPFIFTSFLFWGLTSTVSAVSLSDKAYFGIEHPTASTHLRLLQSAQTDTFLPLFSALPIALPSSLPNNVGFLPTVDHDGTEGDTNPTTVSHSETDGDTDTITVNDNETDGDTDTITVNDNEIDGDTNTTTDNHDAISEISNTSEERPPSRHLLHDLPGCPEGEETLDCDDCGGGEYHERADEYRCKGIEDEEFKWKGCYCLDDVGGEFVMTMDSDEEREILESLRNLPDLEGGDEGTSETSGEQSSSLNRNLQPDGCADDEDALDRDEQSQPDNYDEDDARRVEWYVQPDPDLLRALYPVEETRASVQEFSDLPGSPNRDRDEEITWDIGPLPDIGNEMEEPQQLLTIGDSQSNLNYAGIRFAPQEYPDHNQVTGWNTFETSGNAQPHAALHESPSTDFWVGSSQPSIYQASDLSHVSHYVGSFEATMIDDEVVQSSHDSASFGDSGHEVRQEQAWSHQLPDFSESAYRGGLGDLW